MATADIVQAEARERPRVAVVAGVAAALTLAGSLVGRLAAGSPPDNLPAALLFYHRHQVSQYASGACSALGAVAIAVVLDFLYRAARARNPELSGWIRALPWVGGIGVAVFTVAYQIALAINVKHFATHGSQTYEEARKAVDAGVPPLLALLVQLALAVAIVLISVNAMRTGLLTRFLGYLGVISGVLFVFAFVPIPIVQVYWLGALALLFLGRMPSGTPPAWEQGEAVPWPTTAELRDQRVREAEARRGGGAQDDAVDGSIVESDDEPVSAALGAGGAKRKRKKRR
jgi:chromate transport protein ChrA